MYGVIKFALVQARIGTWLLWLDIELCQRKSGCVSSPMSSGIPLFFQSLYSINSSYALNERRLPVMWFLSNKWGQEGIHWGLVYLVICSQYPKIGLKFWLKNGEFSMPHCPFITIMGTPFLISKLKFSFDKHSVKNASMKLYCHFYFRGIRFMANHVHILV